MMVGAFGAVALAANQITMSATMTLYMVELGIASAAGLRIAQAVGVGDRARHHRRLMAGSVTRRSAYVHNRVCRFTGGRPRGGT
jgi:Na+-driven multidrug efflux pump